MSIMQIAAEFSDNEWFVRRDFDQPGVSVAHFESKTFRSIASCRRCWSVSAERHPIAIIFSRKIILKPVPFSLRLIEPVHMPDPLQIIRALSAHEIDNVPVGRDVPRWSILCPTVPFPIPAKPVSIRFRPPLDQNRRAESFGVARPGAKIDIEISSDNLAQRKGFLRMPLIDIRTQHQPDIRNFLAISNPAAHDSWKFS